MLAEIIQPRMEEIFGLVRENLVAAASRQRARRRVVSGAARSSRLRPAGLHRPGQPAGPRARRTVSAGSRQLQTPIFATGGPGAPAAQEEAWTPASE